MANTSWSAGGKYGGALSFNGSSSLVTIPNAASLQLTTGMTLEAWVDPSTVNANWRDVIYKGDDNYYLEGTSANGSLPGGGGTFVANPVYGASALTANSWTFLAVSYDKTTLRLYVNGTQVATLAATANIATSSNPLQIGGDSLYGQYFAGLIDNVRVYNTALTAAQIQTDMNTPISTASDTTPPGKPGTLTATAVSATEVDLSWGAASDNVGVTGYHIERCPGSGCSNFAEIGTTSGIGTTYKDLTTTAGTSYRYQVRAGDAAGNLGPYSDPATATTPAPDTIPPGKPGTLTATAVSATEVDLSWGAASDNVGVTGYHIERCQGSGCSNFTEIGTTSGTGTAYKDLTTTAGTSYRYQVRAGDAAGNLGPYSDPAAATTPVPSGPTPVAAYAFDEGSGSMVTDARGAGTTERSRTRSGRRREVRGRVELQRLELAGDDPQRGLAAADDRDDAGGVGRPERREQHAWRDVIYKGNDNYYLEATSNHTSRPAGGGTFGTAVGPSALTANIWAFLAVSYDKTTVRLYVNGTQVATLAATANIATSANPLQIGGDSLYGQYFAGLIDNVRVYNTALTAAQIQTDMNTAISTAPDTTPPGKPGTLTATAVSATEVDLSWGAASDNVGVTGYHIERCQGSGCSNFAEIGTTSGIGTTYKDLTTTAGTSYRYQVRAGDAAGNLGPYSDPATATTPAPDTIPPGKPGTLTATAVSATEVDLRWGAATDNVGVTGYHIERCSGSSCSNFTEIGTTSGTGTTYNDLTTTAGTSYRYQVRASDAAGNLGLYSGYASATTPVASRANPGGGVCV